MNKIIYLLIFFAIVIIGGVVYTLQTNKTDYEAEPEQTVEVIDETEVTPVTEFEEPQEVVRGPESVIGQSEDGNDIMAYHFGDGDKEILFVGGIHGGYSGNTALVAYEIIDDLKANSNLVPAGYTVTVIPVLNPDGLSKITGETGRPTANDLSASESERVASRFNANQVDLNRNFDCEWEETGTWQNKSVSGGSAPFSESESKAMQTYVDNNNVVAAVVYYSAAGGVYASQCKNGTMPRTTELLNVYADASGYGAHEEFDFYEITGDMVNWLAKERIPAISVLLTDYQSTEWTKNKAGVEAVLNYFAE